MLAPAYPRLTYPILSCRTNRFTIIGTCRQDAIVCRPPSVRRPPSFLLSVKHANLINRGLPASSGLPTRDPTAGVATCTRPHMSTQVQFGVRHVPASEPSWPSDKTFGALSSVSDFSPNYIGFFPTSNSEFLNNHRVCFFLSPVNSYFVTKGS